MQVRWHFLIDDQFKKQAPICKTNRAHYEPPLPDRLRYPCGRLTRLASDAGRSGEGEVMLEECELYLHFLATFLATFAM